MRIPPILSGSNRPGASLSPGAGVLGHPCADGVGADAAAGPVVDASAAVCAAGPAVCAENSKVVRSQPRWSSHDRPRVRLLSSAAAIAVIVSAMASPPNATAADPEPSPTPQQVTYNADWVEGLRPEDLSPSRAAICIVDSGVAITPDTPADNPDGPILIRDSIDPATIPGTPPPGTSDTATHGTYMASAAIAPRNSWGTVGLHPLGRVISVRASADSSEAVTVADARRAISRCMALRGDRRLVAIGLSLGRIGDATDEEEADFADIVGAARRKGIAVVGAAGNESAADVQFPARVAGVLAVGGGGPSGACSYATTGSRVDLFGPACGVLETEDFDAGGSGISDRGGSSMAAVWTAMAVAVLNDLEPGLDGPEAQRALIDQSDWSRGAPYLDLEAAAVEVGAGSAVQRARGRLVASSPEGAAEPAPITQPQSASRQESAVVPTPTGPSRANPPFSVDKTPRTEAFWRKPWLTIDVRLPRRNDVAVVYAGRRRAVRRLRTPTTRLRFSVRPRRVCLGRRSDAAHQCIRVKSS